MIRGDMFYANLDGNMGSEQGGCRPVVIIQNDVGNKYSPTVIVACCTTQFTKAKLPTHVVIEQGACGNNKTSMLLLEQIRTVDKRRLENYVGTLNAEYMEKIDVALKISIGIA